MGRVKNCVGNRFGRLVVLEEYRGSKGHIVRLCRCDCGVIKEVALRNLSNGTTKSCGCYSKENVSKRNRVHGLGKTRAYTLWSNMVFRCTKENRADYKHYGGRGITVCDRWLSSFEVFFADVGHPPEGMTFDRIDVSKGYCPENCRWATRKEQTRNRRMTKKLEVLGVLKTVAEWAEETGVPYSSIISRINKGYAGEEALYGVGYDKASGRP